MWPGVLKCRFYYSVVMRPTDQEKTAIEDSLLRKLPRGGSIPSHVGPHEKALASVRRQELARGKCGKSGYCGFCRKE